ncbi:ACT domain-containing protein [Fertoeibacter niger]|nr:ACT domain-containing protein [Fertoeibacter niger]
MMDKGETDLATLLRCMVPVLHDQDHGFGLLAVGMAMPAGLAPFAIVAEAEGTTLIAPAADLARHGIAHRAGWARISLTVHSDLAAVGLTAAFATALARQGISANVVAGWHHDHIFVQRERAAEAMAALAALAGPEA